MCFMSGIHMGAVRGIHGGETLAETEGSREFFLVFFGFFIVFFLRSESPPSYFLIMKVINYSSPGEACGSFSLHEGYVYMGTECEFDPEPCLQSQPVN